MDIDIKLPTSYFPLVSVSLTVMHLEEVEKGINMVIIYLFVPHSVRFFTKIWFDPFPSDSQILKKLLQEQILNKRRMFHNITPLHYPTCHLSVPA